MLPYFTSGYGNPSSLYAFGQQAKSDLEQARAEIAACRQIAENAPPEVREKLQAAMVALAKTLEK